MSVALRRGARPLAHVAEALDLVILVIGTNSLKFTDSYGAARGADCLVKLILEHEDRVPRPPRRSLSARRRCCSSRQPVILPEIDDSPLAGSRWSPAVTLFAPEYARIAQARRIDFLDAARSPWPIPADCIRIGATSTPCARRGRRSKVRCSPNE